MLLLGVEKENGWLFAEYRLTYIVGWEHIWIVYNILCKQKSQEKLKKKDIEKRDS